MRSHPDEIIVSNLQGGVIRSSAPGALAAESRQLTASLHRL